MACSQCVLQEFYRLESWEKTWLKNSGSKSSIRMWSEKRNFPCWGNKRFSSRVLHPIWAKVGPCQFHAHSQWWVSVVQALGPDCCVTVWKWSNSDRNVKSPCSERQNFFCSCLSFVLGNSKKWTQIPRFHFPAWFGHCSCRNKWDFLAANIVSRKRGSTWQIASSARLSLWALEDTMESL